MLLLRKLVFVCLTFGLVRALEHGDGFDLSDALQDDSAEPRDDINGFDLSDALGEDSPKPRNNNGDFDLSDALGEDSPKPRNNNDDFDLSDALREDSPKPRDDNDGFDLSDALREDSPKPRNDNDEFDLSDALGDDSTKPRTGRFDDSDLQDVVNSDYKPEKTNSKGQDPPTAIDLISDLVMALIGGTSEQVKRVCFSLLEMFTEQYSNAMEQ